MHPIRNLHIPLFRAPQLICIPVASFACHAPNSHPSLIANLPLPPPSHLHNQRLICIHPPLPMAPRFIYASVLHLHIPPPHLHIEAPYTHLGRSFACPTPKFAYHYLHLHTHPLICKHPFTPLSRVSFSHLLHLHASPPSFAYQN